MKSWKLLIPPSLGALTSFIFPFVYWPEMLNWPFILDRGWLPYRDFSIIHTPLLPLSLTFFYRIFGFQPFVLHLFGSLLFFLTNLVVVFVVKKITKSFGYAMAAGLIHVFLVLAFEGNTVWFESFLAPILLLIFWVQWEYLRHFKLKKIVISGFLMGIVLLIKQTALFVIPEFLVFLVYLFWIKKINLRTIFKVFFAFTCPVIFLILLFGVALYRWNILNDFLAWGITFPFLLPALKQPGLEPDLFLPTLRQTILLAFFCLTIIYGVVKNRNFVSLFLALWCFLSLLFAYPRFEYFHLLPFSAFFAIFIAYVFHKVKNKLPFIVFITIIVVLVTGILRNTYIIGRRFLNVEAIEISAWVVTNYPNASIFSLNGPDIIYFLTQKTPAVRPWVDQLPWEMAFGGENFSNAFIQSKPEIIVFRPYLTKSDKGLGAYQPVKIVDFFKKNYHLIKSFRGGVEIYKLND